MTAHVLVVGAGMVGTCTALHLVRRGHAVTLIDRNEPGRETSYGNAGIVQREAVEPYPFPREWGKLLGVVLGRGADVNYHWGALPALAAPLRRYWANSLPARHAVITQAYAQLIAHSTSEHAVLMDEAGADDLVSREGYRAVFRRPETMAAAVEKARLQAERYGIRFQTLDSQALAAAEPVLRRSLAGAIHWQDPWSVSNPGELVSRYAALFQRLGGQLARGDAETLHSHGAGWRISTADGVVEGDQAVLALGPWSDVWLRRMGYRFPLFVKRGYHRHYRGGEAPRLPFLDADGGLVVAPMQQGVRITTGAEFAGLDAPATPVQIGKAHALASELLDLPDPVEPTPWMGARPMTADMLPIIGAAPRHRGLWLNLGHGHQGFTLGPVSGRLMAEMVDGAAPVVDPAPYAATRFL